MFSLHIKLRYKTQCFMDNWDCFIFKLILSNASQMPLFQISYLERDSIITVQSSCDNISWTKPIYTWLHKELNSRLQHCTSVLEKLQLAY